MFRLLGSIGLVLALVLGAAVAQQPANSGAPEVLRGDACGPGAQQPCANSQAQVSYSRQAPAGSSGDQPTCRDYAVPVIVDGKTVQATGRACLQADGSWRVTQETPGLPTQIYTVPPPPAYPEGSYPDPYAYPSPYDYSYWVYDPWFYGPPYWFGGFAFANNFLRFRRFNRFNHFQHFHPREGLHQGGMHPHH